MTRAMSVLVVTLSIGRTGAAAAEAGDEKHARLEARRDTTSEPGDALSIWGRFGIGVVDAPYSGAELLDARSQAGQARLVQAGGAIRVMRGAWVGVRAAYVLGGVEQPAGSYRATRVWGNPMLFAEGARAELADSIVPRLEGRLRLGIGLPLAERGEPNDQVERRGLAVADALEGMTESELFTPEVLPLVATGSLVLRRDHLHLSTTIKLPLLVRLSDETVPDGASAAALAFTPSCEARATTWLAAWLGLSLAGTLAWPVARSVYRGTRRGSPQAMVAPRLLFAIGSEVLIVLDAGIAAGGPLSGTASAGIEIAAWFQ